MKPYYQHEGIVIYNADCREVLPIIEKVDLVLTDPPYGISYDPKVHKKYDGSENDHQEIKGDVDVNYSFLLSMPCNQIIWGAENFYQQLPFRGRWICWDKRSPVTEANKMPSGDFELAWMNKKTGFYKMFRIIHGGVINANSECGANNDPRLHPTEKPISLMRSCIELFPDSQIVCDPFMGSGTTLRAAKDLNRQAIGIEIEEKYCEIAAKRLSQEVFNFLPPSDNENPDTRKEE